MKKNKDRALRAACRLHQILSDRHSRCSVNSAASISILLSEQQSVERYWRMYNKALSRGWTHSAERLLSGLYSQIGMVHRASRNIHPTRQTAPPTAVDILAEIHQLQAEFDLVEIDLKEKRIEVTTDAITLEEIHLGAFSIQLHFDRLARRRDSSAFVIIAEDPNAASSDSACTHPHVRDESLCAGDATAPISHALAEGRIGDAFQLINRVLHTYNGGSAYVSLSDWDGRDCGDCGNATPSDCLYACELCSSDFCEDCIRTCDRCERSVCCNCSESNADGDRLCPKCKILDDKEREEADEEEETPLSDDPVYVPTEEEPQPTTETINEHSHTNPTETRPAAVEFPGSTQDGGGRTVTVRVSSAQAA